MAALRDVVLDRLARARHETRSIHRYAEGFHPALAREERPGFVL
ncbi:hypothetical protein [Botrimarina hoheduenensis]|nr:hypothetical protein [Botrimarina hoheduenensis]